MIPKSALLLALRIACTFGIAKILAQDLDGTRQENQRDVSLNGTCEHVKSPGGVKDNNSLSTAEETALGQDVVASTLQDNCGEVRPEDADVMWAECIFTATRVTYFSFSLKQENADPRVFSQNNQRVSYDAKDLTLVRHGKACLYLSKARLRISMSWIEDRDANIMCAAKFASGAIFMSKPVPVTRRYRPCPPHLVAKFDADPSQIYFGKPLTVHCWAAVGTGGHLYWALRTWDDRRHTWRYDTMDLMDDKVHIVGALDKTQPLRGPTMSSSITIAKPRHFSGSSVACIVERPQHGARRAQIAHNFAEPLSVATAPIEIIYPADVPRLLVNYHDPPTTVYIHRQVVAYCSALLKKKDHLKWVLMIGGHIYSWQVTRDAPSLSAIQDDALENIKIIISDTFQLKSGETYVSTKLSTTLTSIFQDTLIECQHVSGGGAERQSVRQTVKPITLAYLPQMPQLSVRYTSLSHTLEVKINCSSYIGTNGSLVWRITRAGKPNITWGYSHGPAATALLFGSIMAGVNMLQPAVYYDRENGPGIKSGMTIKIDHRFDNVLVTCFSTGGLERADDIAVTHQKSERISIKGAVRLFRSVWHNGSYNLQEFVLVLFTVPLILLVAMGLTDIAYLLCPILLRKRKTLDSASVWDQEIQDVDSRHSRSKDSSNI